MAKVCEGCGREFEDRSVRCPICKRALVSMKGGGWEKENVEWVQPLDWQKQSGPERGGRDWEPPEPERGRQARREEPERDRQAWREEQEQDWREQREQKGQVRQMPQSGRGGQRPAGGRTGHVQGVRTWHLQGAEARARQRQQNRPARSAGQPQGVQTWNLPGAEARAAQRQQARPGRPAGQEQGVQTWNLPGVEAKAAQRQQERREQSAQERALRDYAGRKQSAQEPARREKSAQEMRGQTRREQAMQEQSVRGQTRREQAMQEQEMREQAWREQAMQEQEIREEIRQIEDWEQDLDFDEGRDGLAEGESSSYLGEISEFEDWVRKNHLTEEDLQYIKSTARNRALLYCLFAGPLCLNAWTLYKIIKQRTFNPKIGVFCTLYALITSISFITILPAILWYIAKKTAYGTGVRGICKNGLAGCGEAGALRREKFRAIQKQSFLVRILAAAIISLGDFIYSALTQGVNIRMIFEDFFGFYFIFAIICIFVDNWRYIRACRKEGQKLGSGTGMLEELKEKLEELQGELARNILSLLGNIALILFGIMIILKAIGKKLLKLLMMLWGYDSRILDNEDISEEFL